VGKAKKKNKEINNILTGILKTAKKRSETAEALQAWKGLVDGKTEFSRPVSFKGGRLVVNISDSAHLHDLTMKRKEIISGMNECLTEKKIKEIRLKIGEI
jgi:hypothetical protein